MVKFGRENQGNSATETNASARKNEKLKVESHLHMR